MTGYSAPDSLNNSTNKSVQTLFFFFLAQVVNFWTLRIVSQDMTVQENLTNLHFADPHSP